MALLRGHRKNLLDFIAIRDFPMDAAHSSKEMTHNCGAAFSGQLLPAIDSEE